MTSIMMECGHAAQAVDGNGAPVCVICAGIHPGARIVSTTPPDLTGRTARCAYFRTGPNPSKSEGPCGRGMCHCERPSSPSLAFFEHTPSKSHDNYYCGCFGWD